MLKMSDVSVIIPTWNRAATIEKAVCSTLAQTASPLEVLVCDDGSTDETEHIVKSIGDQRVRWIPGPHGGRPAIPRNRGIIESRGNWLAFLDSDDEWLPEKLERQLSLSERTECKAVCCNAYRFIPGKGIEGVLLPSGAEMVTFQDLLQVNHVICSSAMIHKSIFATVIGFPEAPQLKASEDYALWLRVATQTDFVFVSEPLVNYTDDPINSVRNAETNVWRLRKNVMGDFILWGQSNHISDEYLRKAKRQCNTAEWNFNKERFVDFLRNIFGSGK